MSTRALRAFIAVAAAICLVAVTASAAGASTVYVSNSAPVVAGGKSCAQPEFNKVQEAITAAAGGTVNVCAGTYTEQLSITGSVKLAAVSGVGTATLQMPASPAQSMSACDTKEALVQSDEVSICTNGTVTMSGLNVEAIVPLATCAGGLNAIFIAGGGNLKASNISVNGASTSLNGYKGCQHGIAILVGSASRKEVGHATLKGITVKGYEKNGPTSVGVGSTMAISSSAITGEGETPYIAQNGIEIAYGGGGTVKSTSIKGNECNVGSCGPTGEQASGVLFFEAATGSTLTGSTIQENDLGAYYASGEATVPASPEVTISKDVFTSNRYEAVDLEEGKASLSTDTINGSGRVGIDLFQYEGQTSASESSATKIKISGQAEAAIKVESDKKAGDIAGKFVITKSTESGNGSVLINESNNFEVIF